MANLAIPNRLDRQVEMYTQVAWRQSTRQAGPLPTAPDRGMKGPPAGLRSGASKDKDKPPYWECDCKLDDTCGLLLTNVCVRDTQSVGSSEPVFTRIDFTDLEIEFNDGQIVPFNVSRALRSADALLETGEDGSRYTVEPHDELFQRGLRLVLEDNVLEGAGTCNVQLQLSVTLRGSANDFDPGGIPVALQVFPQVSWRWYDRAATKSVKRFRASVRLFNENYMSMDMGPGHAGGMPPMANVASLFCDSNTAFGDGLVGMLRTPVGWTFPPPQLAQWADLPTSWPYLFDYVRSDQQTAGEFVAVHGPSDGKFYSAGAGDREKSYLWPVPQTDLTFFHVKKANRQGAYDNIHLHARMAQPYPGDHVQVHAPFCGHSCIHMHWRWSSISPRSAFGGRGWAYRGWSDAEAHQVDDAPLVPPNQRVTVAICKPETVRSSHDSILGGRLTDALDPRYKMIWYCTDIHAPKAGKKQVTFEHGAGWAWRFAFPSESPAIIPLLLMNPAILQNPLLLSTLTQAGIADTFTNYVYPHFRFYNGALGFTFQLSPEGTHDILAFPAGAHGTPMEQL